MNKTIKSKVLYFVIIGMFFASHVGAATNAQVALSDEQRTINAIKKVLPSVVSISITGNAVVDLMSVETGLMSTTSKKQQLGAGTGFIISTDGLIMTNKHVVDYGVVNSVEYLVTLNSSKRYKAKLIGKDPTNDLAVLKIEATKLPAVQFGNSGQLELGQSVVAIGNALGVYKNSVTKGIVSGLNRSIVASGNQVQSESLSNVIQTDAQINLGNSGGPLINLSGEVIGVNVAVDEGGQSLGFAIPANEVKPVVVSVKRDKKIIRPRLGIMFVNINAEIADQLNLAVDYGALIRGTDTSAGVIAGSPAAKAGLMDGDIIVEVDGKKLNKIGLLELIGSYRPGQKIGLVIRRDTRKLMRTVILGSF